MKDLINQIHSDVATAQGLLDEYRELKKKQEILTSPDKINIKIILPSKFKRTPDKILWIESSVEIKAILTNHINKSELYQKIADCEKKIKNMNNTNKEKK